MHAEQYPPDQEPPSADTRGEADRPPQDAFDEAVRVQRDLRTEALLAEADRLGPDPRFADLTDDAVVCELGTCASTVAAATARLLALTAELVVRRVWAEQGARTPAEWLSWKLGLAPSTAREHVRVALRLRSLPRVAGRFAEGVLSYSKVRAITRLAAVEDEDLLLMWADHGTAADLDRIAAATRSTLRQATEELQPDEDRAHRWRVRTHHDGTATLTLTGPVEDVLALEGNVRRLAEALVRDREPDADEPSPEPVPGPSSDPVFAVGADPSPDVRAGSAADGDALDPRECWPAGPQKDRQEDRPSPRVRAADRVAALLTAVQVAAAAGTPPDTSGLDAHTMVIQVAVDSLAGGDGADDPTAVVPVHDDHRRVRAMHRGVLRRLACEAGLRLAATDGGSVLDVGRRSRQVSAALRRALHLRDRGCAFPGCGATRHLHAHHVEHWADGGPTDRDNLVLLCAFHHRYVHSHPVRIEVAADGRHRFHRVSSCGAGPGQATQIVAVPDLPGAGDRPLPRPAAASAEALTPPGYHGDRVDLNAAVAVLQQRYERAAAASEAA